jgi:hypothetical protein
MRHDRVLLALFLVFVIGGIARRAFFVQSDYTPENLQILFGPDARTSSELDCVHKRIGLADALKKKGFLDTESKRSSSELVAGLWECVGVAVFENSPLKYPKCEASVINENVVAYLRTHRATQIPWFEADWPPYGKQLAAASLEKCGFVETRRSDALFGPR